jgi:hypothetical protein
VSLPLLLLQIPLLWVVVQLVHLPLLLLLLA